jgi:trimethylamine--corrinoid protein Co-methyltransferase
MDNIVNILTQQQLAEVHERSLKILAKTGVKVENAEVRKMLKAHGAEASNVQSVIKLPAKMIEEALSVTTKRFTLGGRRKGFSFTPGEDECAMCLSGEAVFVSESAAVRPREGLNQDFLDYTRLGEAHDEVAMFWRGITPSDRGDSMGDFIDYLIITLNNFTKHIQDPFQHLEQGPWLLEVLGAVFGGKQGVKRTKPYSTLFCPQSPLILKDQELAAVLSLHSWDIPVAIMPMALMGGTAPASLLGTLCQVNAEILASLTVFQCDEPGRPIIYAPVLTLIEPRTGLYFAGGVEQALMNAAAAQMAGFYSLPSMITGLETDAFQPGLQAAEDKVLTSVLPFLSGADIFIGPGLLGGDMILSLEQMLLDLEIFRKLKRLRRGFGSEAWLDDVLEEVGPGGNFLAHPSTAKNIRKLWHTPSLGQHGSLEKWFAPEAKDSLAMARAKIKKTLDNFQQNPMEESLIKELNKIKVKAAKVKGCFGFV